MEQKKDMNENIFKIDIRNVIIILLILFCIWLFFNPFGGNKVKELENDNTFKQAKIDSLQKQRDNLFELRKDLDRQLLFYKDLSELRGDTILFYKKLSKFKDYEIKDLKGGMETYNEMLRRRKQEIDDLLKDPIVLPKQILVEKSSEKFK